MKFIVILVGLVFLWDNLLSIKVTSNYNLKNKSVRKKRKRAFIFNTITSYFRSQEYWQIACNNYLDLAFYYIPASKSTDLCSKTPALYINDLKQLKSFGESPRNNTHQFYCSDFKPTLSTLSFTREQAEKKFVSDLHFPRNDEEKEDSKGDLHSLTHQNNTTHRFNFTEDLINVIKHETRCYPGYHSKPLIVIGIASLNSHIPFLNEEFIPSETQQNFDVAEFIKVMAPDNKKNDLTIEFLSSYINEYVEKVVSYRKITEEIRPIELILGDLKIKRVKVLLRSLISTVKLAFHEMLAMCGIGKNGTAYFFLFDRTAVNSQSIDDTLLRVIYLGYSTDCNSNNTLWPDKDPKNKDEGITFVFSKENADMEIDVGDNISHSKVNIDDSNAKEKNKESDKDSITIQKKGFVPDSFDGFLSAIWEYSLKYPKYKIDHTNCQHFATGFFNTLAATEARKIPFYNNNVERGESISFRKLYRNR